MTVEKLLFGALIGTLCGAVHLIIAIIMKKTLVGIIGEVCSIGGGILFACIGKSPFTAVIIALLFILFMIVDSDKHSSGSKHIEKSVNAEVITPSPEDSNDGKKDNNNSDEK